MIKIGNIKETDKRSYGWEDHLICYTGYNSKPFKVDKNNYQLKCICNAGEWSVNKFKTIYINFDLSFLGITEKEFLSHFVMLGYIIEFYVYYDRSCSAKNYIHAYRYHDNNKFIPDKYGRYAKVFKMLDDMKPQTRIKKGKIKIYHHINGECVTRIYDNYGIYLTCQDKKVV